MNNKLKALIFDVDGTMADTERDGHRVAFNQAFEEFDINWNWGVETYGRLLSVTGGKERMKYFATDFLNNENLPDNLDAIIPQIHQAKTRHYMDLLSTGAIPLRPGVERLLNEAMERDIRISIATTTTPENVTSLLEHTLGKESINWFEVIAAGDIVPSKKPSADIYNYTLESMQLEAKDCIAFEDSRNGILSSLGANLITVITINEYTKEHDFSGASIVLDQMGEPEAPFTVMQGKMDDYSFLNCDMLLELHQ